MKTKLVNVGYAPITKMDPTGVTYGKPVYFAAAEAGGREYEASPQGDTKEIDANSLTVYSAESNNGYEIKLTLIDIIDDIAENWLDFKICENGVLEIANEKEKPRFALILSDSDIDDVGKTEIFYNCVCTARPSIAGKTSEGGSWDEQFVEYTIKASPRLDNRHVRFTVSGVAELTEIPEPTPKTATVNSTNETEG